ncbi:MAG: enoyl-CoA hydratase/isomerase family protein [Nannocystales bacterium]
MSPVGLHEESRDGALWWTLDKPERRNAIGPEALRWISRRSATLRGETVVLRGAGDSAFCAGFDLTALQPSADGPPPDHPLAEATAAIESADATFIAAINGFAIGAGLELACACDLRIACDDAWFAIPAAKLGVVYHAAGLQRLHAVLGQAILRRLLLLGERVHADALAEAGALTHLVARTALPATIETTIAALGRGDPMSQGAHRRFLRALQRGAVSTELLEAHRGARSEAYARIRETRDTDRGR